MGAGFILAGIAHTVVAVCGPQSYVDRFGRWAWWGYAGRPLGVGDGRGGVAAVTWRTRLEPE